MNLIRAPLGTALGALVSGLLAKWGKVGVEGLKVMLKGKKPNEKEAQCANDQLAVERGSVRKSGSKSSGDKTEIEATHTTGIPQTGVLIKFHKGLHVRDLPPFWGLLTIFWSSCKMVLKLRDPFCGQFFRSPKAYWG